MIDCLRTVDEDAYTELEYIDEQCRVCGDKAIGYNFGVITCDSCRSFFRRSVSSEKVPRCLFQARCNISKESRKCCQGCRLSKCFQLGMFYDSVRSEGGGAIPRKRHRRCFTQTLEMTVESSPPNEPAPHLLDHYGYQRLADSCPVPVVLAPLLPSSAAYPLYTPPAFFARPATPLSLNAPGPSFLSSTPAAEPAKPVVAMPADQAALLLELVEANSVLKAPMELSLQELENPNELSLMTVVRISDLAMRRIIAMVKKLRAFKAIEHRDQFALLKGGLSELLILRGAMAFDPAKDAWIHHIYSGSQPIQLRVDVLKKTPEQEHYEAHKRFLLSFEERWRNNEELMLILNGIILFSPERRNIQNVYEVRRAQNFYLELLHVYLSRLYASADLARSTESQLMHKLQELRELNRSLQRIYNILSPDDLEPLVEEIYYSDDWAIHS